MEETFEDKLKTFKDYWSPDKFLKDILELHAANNYATNRTELYKKQIYTPLIKEVIKYNESK